MIDTWATAAYLAFIAFAAGITVAVGFRRKSRPTACKVLVYLTVLVGILGLVAFRGWEFLSVLFWFLFAGSFALPIAGLLRAPRMFVSLNWHTWVLNALGVLGVFAGLLYPHVPSHLGGGEKSRIVLQFVAVSPIDGSPRSDFWLVDEVDSGFYVLRAKTDKKAVFIPRALVSAIYFEPSAAPQ